MLRSQRSSGLLRQRWASEAGGESPAYSIVSVTPSAGSEMGGTSVTIVISGFDANDISDIFFGCDSAGVGGDLATDISATNATTVTCLTPASPFGSGSANVKIEAPGITVVGLAVFTYI
jgi:hypothetical protein